MRQIRIYRTNALLLGLIAAGACGVSYAGDLPLVFQDENAAPFGAMQVLPLAGGASQTIVRTQVPVLCGSNRDTAAPVQYKNGINPQFAGISSGGDFKFGALTNGAQSAVDGIGFWNYRPNGLAVQAELTTHCYVLDAHGAHKASAGLFSDTFDGAPAVDPSITTSVAVLPSFSSSYYTYYVDVRIPAELAGMFYRVRDGFDSSVFAFGGQASRYCEVAIGVTQCNLSDMVTIPVNVDVLGKVPPTGGVARRFIVQRMLNGSATLPADVTLPLTMAALFVEDGRDDNLANNVSVGRAQLSDLAPTIIAASNLVPNLAEGTGATNLSFTLTDDTVESGPQLLNAAVTIDFNGTLVPATNVSCSQLDTPQSGEAVRRTCRFDIPSFDPDFATDADPAAAGNYAPNVHAAVLITATDVRGQQSTKTVPFHVVSGDNDPPSFTLSSLMEEFPANGKTPTLLCSLSSQQLPAQCAGVIADFVNDLRPGPARAFDENAAQGVFLGTFAGNRLSCTGTSIFSSNLADGLQSPRYIFNGSHIDLDYRLNGTLGTAECSVAAADYNFPSTQTGNSRFTTFRITVTN
jgi:hypothetical protein